MALIKPEDWNQMHIVARGHQLTHIINGQVMTVLIDEDPEFFRPRVSSDFRSRCLVPAK